MKSMSSFTLSASSTKLPPQLQYLNRLKAKAEDSARLLESTHPKLSHRLMTCGDVLLLKECKNGYKALNRARWCRVRGCPLCNRVTVRRNMGRTAKVMQEARDYRTGIAFRCISLPTRWLPISEIGESWTNGARGLANFMKRRTVRSVAYITSAQIEIEGDLAKVTMKALLVGAPRGGRYFLNQKQIAEMWRESYGDFEGGVIARFTPETRPVLDFFCPVGAKTCLRFQKSTSALL